MFRKIDEIRTASSALHPILQDKGLNGTNVTGEQIFGLTKGLSCAYFTTVLFRSAEFIFDSAVPESCIFS